MTTLASSISEVLSFLMTLESSFTIVVGLQYRRLDCVFNSNSGCMNVMSLLCNVTKLSNLELKTRPKQLSGSLPLSGVHTMAKIVLI
jgi:hypothetical protein